VLEKYHTFYEGLNVEGSPNVVLYPLYFMVRRLLLGLTIVLLDQTVIWQVAMKTASVIANVILVGQIMPFTDHSKYKMEFVNEVLVMFVLYHMIIFTPFLHDFEV